jgi:hypothetical protein
MRGMNQKPGDGKKARNTMVTNQHELQNSTGLFCKQKGEAWSASSTEEARPPVTLRPETQGQRGFLGGKVGALCLQELILHGTEKLYFHYLFPFTSPAQALP